jgi:RAT1-interacting protein
VMPDVWDNVSRDFLENRHKENVSNKAQYCSVVKTGFANSSLIIGGEVDAGMQSTHCHAVACM